VPDLISQCPPHLHLVDPIIRQHGGGEECIVDVISAVELDDVFLSIFCHIDLQVPAFRQICADLQGNGIVVPLKPQRKICRDTNMPVLHIEHSDHLHQILPSFVSISSPLYLSM